MKERSIYLENSILASHHFGCYSCLLGFLRPLLSRRSLLATSWRRSFGLFLAVAILWLFLHWGWRTTVTPLEYDRNN